MISCCDRSAAAEKWWHWWTSENDERHLFGSARKILIDFGEALKFTPAPSSGQINTTLSNGCLSAAVKLFIGKFIPVSDSLGGQRFLNEMLMCSRCTLVNFAHTSIMEIHNYTPCVKIKSLWCCGRRWRNRRGKMLPPLRSLKVISWVITAYNRLWGVNFMSWLKLLWRSQTLKVYSQQKKGGPQR